MLIPLEPIVNKFSTATQVTNSIMQQLKTKGLTPQTRHYFLVKLKELKETPKLRRTLQIWLRAHTKKQKALKHTASLVSSDVIESLFGKFKFILEKTPKAEISSNVLLIPSMCGSRKPAQISQILKSTGHQDKLNWVKSNIKMTLRRKKTEMLKKIKNPNTGEACVF